MKDAPKMSNLTACKDCGHRVSRRAKVCPSCGLGRPGSRSCGELFAIAFLIFAGVSIAMMFSAYDASSPSDKSAQATRSVQAPAIQKPIRQYTDEQIQEAIEKSDDYETYRDEFTKAAKHLLTNRICGQYEMTQYGGFVKSQTHKNQPVYFTYCGGMNVSNRIYVDVSSGKIFR